jgi:hypothetical protein
LLKIHCFIVVFVFGYVFIHSLFTGKKGTPESRALQESESEHISRNETLFHVKQFFNFFQVIHRLFNNRRKKSRERSCRIKRTGSRCLNILFDADSDSDTDSEKVRCIILRTFSMSSAGGGPGTRHLILLHFLAPDTWHLVPEHSIPIPTPISSAKRSFRVFCALPG